MVIYLGTDHRGFQLKEIVRDFLQSEGYEVHDLGNTVYDEKDDYPDFAELVARKVSLDPDRARGILFCGSGSGMDVAANKFRHVRASIGFEADQVFDMRHDDDVNLLVLASDFTNEIEAKKIVKAFLTTAFGKEERYIRRLSKVADLENQW